MSQHIMYPPELPVSARKTELMAAIAEHQVVIIAGETGSGKTTQIPKMCLELGLARQDSHGRKQIIGHTQPRRLAARTVAQRIAEELDSDLGDQVGYQVRFTAQTGDNTDIKVMTDGILLAEIRKDRLLRRYSTLIIDEAHERSLNIDFLLGYLKQILPQRPDLKLIITSATIDPERFASHFGTPGKPAPIFEVSGRTYPVEIRYRPLEEQLDDDDAESGDDSRDPIDAVCDAVEELSREPAGDILIFFSGEREIRDAATALEARFGSQSRHRTLRDAQILPLFARLSLAEQHAVFTPGPRPRIILATNVAETSLTVPGIKYVIDTGTARISRYSVRTKVQRLPIERISQASAQQRAGRSGRTSDGICIRLYSEEDFLSRPEFTDPEILRTNLAAVILRMISLKVATSPADIANFPFLQPPEAKSINDGVSLLRELGALGSSPAERNKGALTSVGAALAKLPVDPRLGRMIIESGKRDCAREIMVLAAALTVSDPRERPSEKKPQADEKHRRFVDENSDFTTVLNLWRYLQERQAELSSSAFRRLCKAEFINFIRVREWQDLVNQLRQFAKEVHITVAAEPVDPVARHEHIHKSLLTGLLSNIGIHDERKRDYLGARGIRFVIFPGSGLFKKAPDAIMSAELVETSRLFARVNARIDPLWVEEMAPQLIKRTYSEPHWSKRNGSVMAYEKVTLYGLPIVPARAIQYGKIDPALSRELFIRHALVDGDWRTHHSFFRRNQKLLAEVEELQTRMRRTDLLVDDSVLFDFYDARVGTDVVSERHFDKWWKHARHDNPTLLDFDPDALRATEEPLDEAAFPAVLNYEGSTLRLHYEFDPAARYSTDAAQRRADGVGVYVPLLLLNQLDPEPFRWQIPGLREELVTALIRSLPKGIRKHFVPAPDVARAATEILNAEFDPMTNDLEASLELVLRRLKGFVIPPGSWDHSAVPEYLKMSFLVVDAKNKIVDESRDLIDLQESLAPALQRAVAQSLGATPRTVQRGKTHPLPQSSSHAQTGFSEATGLMSFPVEPLADSVSRSVSGHTVTGYPALVDEGTSVMLTVFTQSQTALQAHRRGVIRLLALSLPTADRYVIEHLSNQERLTLGGFGQVNELIADCAIAALDKLVPEQLPRSKPDFQALFERIRAEHIDAVFAVVTQVCTILARLRDVTAALKQTKSLATLSAVQDIQEQLEHLVFNGFVAGTGYTHLVDLPRYLQAIVLRLQKLPTAVARDGQNMATVQALEDAYDDAVAALHAKAPEILGQRFADPALSKVRWMIEELRVSLFAVELGTAYTVSDKRVRKALSEVLAQRS